MPPATQTSVALASMALHQFALQALAAVAGLFPADDVVIQIFGLWDRKTRRFVARAAVKVRSESMRCVSLAGVGAWRSGEKAVSTAPVVLIRPPDSRGHCAVSQWPRLAGRA